jgi:ATP-binding cassette, subfamily C, bacterial
MNHSELQSSRETPAQMSAISYTKSILKTRPLMVVTVTGLMVTAALFDGLILALVALVVELVSNDGETVDGSSVRWVLRYIEFIGLEVTVITATVIALAGMAVRAFLIYMHYWLIGRARGKYEASIKLDLFTASMSASWSYLLANRAGDLVNTIAVEARRVGNAFNSSLLAIAAVLNVATYLVAALLVMWQATLMAVIPVALTLLLFKFAMTRAHKLGRGTTNSNSDLTANISEAFGSAKYIKGSALESGTVSRVALPISNLSVIDEMSGKNNGIVQAGYEFIVLAMLLIGLGIASQFVELQSGTVTLFLLLFVRAYQRARAWQQSFQTLNHHIPSVDKANQALAEAIKARESNPDLQAPKLSESVKLDNVVFQYGDGRKVLDGVSIDIPVGSIAAIVGPSGMGKTTVIDITMGLLTPDSGELLIDGVPLRSLDPQSWRKQIGYVTQDVNLFYDTIERNIAWGDDEPDADKVARVASICGVDKFIRQLPDGYSTVIGDRGLRISGGQRQRIALARAFYREPRLLILDEATSELDSESEEQIQNTIEQIRGDITVLLIAHRLSTVMNADAIHVLSDGAIVESGSSSELMSQKGVFYRMRSDDN